MRILVIGGVAAGTKAAAKIKRLDRSAEVLVITKSKDISYAGCALPYYAGGMIETRDELIVNTPEKYSALTGADVLTGMEAVKLDTAGKTVEARDIASGEIRKFSYDKCVIATGAEAVLPPIEGIDKAGVFKVRTPDDAEKIREHIALNKRAVIVGGGFIGLEMAENLKKQGCDTTVIDIAPQLMPGIFDGEMALYIKKSLRKAGIKVLTGVKVSAVTGREKVEAVITDAGEIKADTVIFAAGVKPNTEFLQDSGLEMIKGAIVTDGQGRTNIENVYAAGDCAMVKNRITGKAFYSPMGSTANYMGRTLAQGICGKGSVHPGVLGTGVAKLVGLSCGRTGLTEAQAKEAGFDAATVVSVTDDKAHYYEGASFFITKLVADRESGVLLGMQVIGEGAVDKMVDIAVTGISMGARLQDFDNLDLSYAPPFSTAIHPFVQAVYVLENKLSGDIVTMTPAEFLAGGAKGYTVIDASPQKTIPGAVFADIATAENGIKGIDKDEKLLLVCMRGKRGYFLQNKLRYAGYTNTKVLEGGLTFNDVKVERKGRVSPEETARLKALGCLWDKRTDDKFNVRVITINGKITAKQHIAIAEAAEKFGSGEVAMTTRLTLEIQGVPYDNVEPLREFLAMYDLTTGGTGSKVRPVVSCKGTTCQYGLIDTFDISEEIHHRFFEGYKDIKLPHKFKIAVGGCPNNCVKPDLNDLGIVGQKVPIIDYDKCRGCKVCQIEKACPIKAAKVENGKITADECNHCGRCVGKCPFKALEEYTTGYRVYLGGRWGKKTAHGRPLSKIFTDKEELFAIIEKAILLFREQGVTGERFADTVTRIGFENVEAQLLSDDLLTRKKENLSAEKHMKGGATC